MVEFMTLCEAFKSYFSSSHADTEISCDDRACWINAIVKQLNNPCVHYELIRRGADYFVELHVEQKLSHELRQRLLDAVPKLRRNYAYFTYYTNQYLQKRTPIQNTDELERDLHDLVDVVGSIYGQGGSQNVEKTTDCTKDNIDLLCDGYEELSLQEVAQRLRNNCDRKFIIPGVQRGRVWNAALMSALWDSLMRRFPVGSFSVRIGDIDGEMELLDGQQRANAISLAFREYPPRPDAEDEKEAKDAGVNPDIIANETPILWLDLDDADAIAGTEFKYAFFVTTASQPWGYHFSGDETRNSLLRTFEKRDAAQRLERLGLTFRGNDSGKPYPCELRPYCAKCPVPFSLLRKFVWGSDMAKPFKGNVFVDWIESQKKHESGLKGGVECWNWFKELKDKISTTEIKEELIKAIQGLKSVRIMCTDSTNVGVDDIALYFTRIGKCRVSPSDEELAFSTLKSKLGSKLGKEFRDTIYAIANQGMASAARLAHIAIRCFKSEKRAFYAGDALSAAVEIAASVEKREKFKNFIDEEFKELIRYVNEKVLELATVPKPGVKAMKGFSNWHLSRFCSVSNGDAYLFLLLEARDYYKTPEAAALQRAAVELISIGGYKLDRCFRYIREREESDYASRIRLGISRALRDSYRSTIMLRPLETPEFFENEKNNAVPASNIFKNGYGNNRAYSILLYACKGALPEYVANSAQWAEENCPWDYDHMLPHSWVDKLGDVEEMECCREVVNSIGNLAPLPYSLNRKLSDDSRLPTYPFTDEKGVDLCKVARYQQSLRIKPDTMGKENKASFGGSDAEARKQRKDFCTMVKTRFIEIYRTWYDGIGFKNLLTFEDVVSFDESALRAKFMIEVFRKLKGEEGIGIYGLEFGEGGVEKSIKEYLSNVLRYSWVSVEKALDDCAVAFTLNLSGSSGSDIEFGVRKLPEKQSTEEDIRNHIAKVDLPYKTDKSENKYWYAYSDMFENCKFEGLNALSAETVCVKIQDLAKALCNKLGRRTIDMEDNLQ